MKRAISILAAAAVLAVGAPVLAQHTGHTQQKAPAAKQAVIKCPVMGGVVKNIKKASKSTYKGKTYYFCCPGCKPLFDKNPEKYIKKTASPKK